MDREQELLALQKRLRELGYEAEDDEKTWTGRLRQKADRMFLKIGKVATKAALIGGALYIGDRHLRAEWDEYHKFRKSLEEKLPIYAGKVWNASKETLKNTWDWLSPKVKALWAKYREIRGESHQTPETVQAQMQKPDIERVTYTTGVADSIFNKIKTATSRGVIYKAYKNGSNATLQAYDSSTLERCPQWDTKYITSPLFDEWVNATALGKYVMLLPSRKKK